MATRIRFYVGHHVNGAHPGQDVIDKRVQDAMNYLSSRAGGVTKFDAKGAWNGLHEPSTVFEVVLLDEPNAHLGVSGFAAFWATTLREVFDQDSVLYTVEPVPTGEVTR